MRQKNHKLIFILLAGIYFTTLSSKGYSGSLNFESEHFTVEKLAEGVFALIHKPGGQAICNAGIIDLGEEVLIFDTFLSRLAAEDMKKAVKKLTGKPVRWVVNSHLHNDHIRGNQVFLPDASVIGSPKTRDYLAEYGMQDAIEEQDYAPGRLAELKKEYSDPQTEEEKQFAKMWFGYFEAMIDGFPGLEIFPPELLLTDTLIIEGSERTAVLVEFPDGHTISDMILYLPDEKILFTGDLVFVKSHPYLADGDIEGLKKILDAISAIEVKLLVPGHGPVGQSEDIGLMKEYIEMVENSAVKAISEGKKPEDVGQSGITEQFSDWIFPHFFGFNLSFVYQNMTDSEQGDH